MLDRVLDRARVSCDAHKICMAFFPSIFHSTSISGKSTKADSDIETVRIAHGLPAKAGEIEAVSRSEAISSGMRCLLFTVASIKSHNTTTHKSDPSASRKNL